MLELIAYERDQKERNRFGILLTEATDPANQTRYVVDKIPTVDWSERALAATQRGYYRDDSADHPMDRSGHLWTPPRLQTD